MTVHKRVVDVGEDAGRLGLNNADVVDTARGDANDLTVHERLDEFGRLAYCFDAIVVSGLERRWRHKWADHCDVLVVAVGIGRALVI